MRTFNLIILLFMIVPKLNSKTIDFSPIKVIEKHSSKQSNQLPEKVLSLESKEELKREICIDSIMHSSSNLLKKVEGFRKNVYVDNKGVKTIGYGFTGKSILSNCDTISRSSADSLLIKKCNSLYNKLDSLIIVDVNEKQMASLISFTYNVGYYGFKSSNLLKELNNGKYQSVPSEMKKWVNIKLTDKTTGKTVKKFSKGLYNRRLEEIDMWNGKS
jgi:GH24 family phage-related lysozyme (muramidase)